MRNLSAFNYNHHPSRVKMVPKIIRRGISVVNILGTMIVNVDVANAVASSITINSDRAGGPWDISLGANTLTVTNGITLNSNSHQT
jgi:hypothetical protein